MFNIDWSKITSLNYWLEGSNIGQDYNVRVIETNSPFFYFFVIFFGGLIVVSILINIYKMFLNTNHPLQSKLSIIGANIGWMGFLGGLWFALRELQVSFLSSRLWLIFGFIWFLVLAVYMLNYLIRFYHLELNYFRSTVTSTSKASKKIKKPV